MSVYTPLTEQDIIALLSDYSLGDYVSHKGISAGVENTNYFVTTTEHELVLTLFEKLGAEALPFFLKLGEHLFNHHCKVPQPFRDNNNEFLKRIKNKPAVFIEKLAGDHVDAKGAYALEIAKAMAEVHLATQQFDAHHRHSHDKAWVIKQAEQVTPDLPDSEQLLLNKAMAIINQIPADLPCGIIHADLFHDNALFHNGHLTGIIDWYFAGWDSFALDIAIAVNDWCQTDGKINLIQVDQFLEAYQTIRPLTDAELTAFPMLQIQSSTRFWLSRWLAKAEHQNSTDEITVKDPGEMRDQLKQLISYTL